MLDFDAEVDVVDVLAVVVVRGGGGGGGGTISVEDEGGVEGGARRVKRKERGASIMESPSQSTGAES